MVSVDKKKMEQLAEPVKEKYNLHTQEDFEKFLKDSPDKLQSAIVDSTNIVKEVLVGKSFDELNLEDMKALQGAGEDMQPETGPICFLASIGVGAVFSLQYCP